MRGARAADRVTWLGIPYARPPVGELRFRAPHPVEPWEGVRDATRYGPVAPQAFRGQFIGAGPGIPSGEDCLTVNVTAPTDPVGADGPLPVANGGGPPGLPGG